MVESRAWYREMPGLAEDLAEPALPAVQDGAVLIDQPAAETVGPVADDEGQAGLHEITLVDARAVDRLGTCRAIERWWPDIGVVGATQRLFGAGELLVGKHPMFGHDEADAECAHQQAQSEQNRRHGVEERARRHRGLVDLGLLQDRCPGAGRRRGADARDWRRCGAAGPDSRPDVAAGTANSATAKKSLRAPVSSLANMEFWIAVMK